MKGLSESERKKKILQLKTRGIKSREIVRLFGITKQRIHQILNNVYKDEPKEPISQKTPICEQCGDTILGKPFIVNDKEIDYGCLLLFWQKKGRNQ